jgi:radical SAM superfamily enzyme YgiQ (UPF0313 family)
MNKKVYLIQPSFRKMDGSIVKSGFVGHNTLNLPILTASIPTDWEKECCMEYNDEINFHTDAALIFIVGISNDIIHGYNIAEKFKQKGKQLIYGGHQDSFSIQLMKEVCNAVYHGIPGPTQMKRILNDALSNNLEKEYHCGVNIDFPFDYSCFKGKKVKQIQFFSSVGCKYKCDYCYHQLSYNGKFYQRNIDHVVQDLKAIRELTKYLAFRDPNFYNDRNRVISLCERIITEKLNITWAAQCPIHIGRDEEVLKLMRKAGCKLIFLGLESLNQNNLKSVHKPFKVREYEKMIAKIHEARIFTVGYFMFGLDYDTNDSFQQVFSFVKRTKLSLPIPNIFIPIPGTRIFERLRNERRLDIPDLDTFLAYKPHYSNPCSKCFFTPKNISRRELEQNYIELFRKLTSYKEILKRSVRFDKDMFKLLYMNLNLRNERIKLEHEFQN